MEKMHAGLIALIGFGLTFLGNALSETGNLFADLLGTGMGVFGGILILYSIYRGAVWIWKKIMGKK